MKKIHSLKITFLIAIGSVFLGFTILKHKSFEQDCLVANIGGVFIFSDQPKELIKWYEKVLKIDHTIWATDSTMGGKIFHYVDKNTSKENYIVWSISPNKKLSKYKREKTHVINLRVYDIKETVEHIKLLNIACDGIEKHDSGLFAWITDPDGNIIELWEDTNN